MAALLDSKFSPREAGAREAAGTVVTEGRVKRFSYEWRKGFKTIIVEGKRICRTDEWEGGVEYAWQGKERGLERLTRV